MSRPIKQIFQYTVEKPVNVAVNQAKIATVRQEQYCILALCEDGTLWCYEDRKWSYIEGPPEAINKPTTDLPHCKEHAKFQDGCQYCAAQLTSL